MTDHADSTDTAVLPATPDLMQDEEEIVTTPPGKKQKRGGLFGRGKKAAAPASAVSGVTMPLAHHTPPGRAGRFVHYSLTTLLLLATTGQFAYFSLRATQLEEDQSALLRRVPAGMTQRLDNIENALASAGEQKAAIAQLKEQVVSLLAQDPQKLAGSLRTEFRQPLEKMADDLDTLRSRQDTLSANLATEQQRLKAAIESLKTASSSQADKREATGATQKTTASKTPAPKKTSTPARKAPVNTAAAGKPPFELRGIEYRGGVAYAVTTTPGDTNFSSLRLLMTGQSRDGWRLVRTTDSTGVFRTPTGKELALAIR